MKKLRPLTNGQEAYLKAIKDNKIVFCIGPAGSGKTAVSSRFGINELLANNYSSLIITRPLVQAGEDTGYLPGDINDKLNPFVRPVFDELKLYIDVKQLKNYIEMEIIEIVPFAYMRGRNFHNAFIIADEAQNATPQQLFMLLTRFGRQSKLIINGDPTQSDLPKRLQGALEKYARMFGNIIPGIATVHLEKEDVVREEIVSEMLKIADAYQENPTE